MAAWTQEARHDGALHPRRHQRARPSDKPARLPVKDARLTRGRFQAAARAVDASRIQHLGRETPQATASLGSELHPLRSLSPYYHAQIARAPLTRMRGTAVAFCFNAHRRRGTGIWPDRSLLTALHLPGPHTRAKSRLLAVRWQNPARRGLSAGGKRIRTFGSASALTPPTALPWCDAA